MVEAYFWSYMVFYEHGYARARIIFAKIFGLTTLLDDTYDVHATIEECRKLDAAMQRLGLVLALTFFLYNQMLVQTHFHAN